MTRAELSAMGWGYDRKKKVWRHVDPSLGWIYRSGSRWYRHYPPRKPSGQWQQAGPYRTLAEAAVAARGASGAREAQLVDLIARRRENLFEGTPTRTAGVLVTGRVDVLEMAGLVDALVELELLRRG